MNILGFILFIQAGPYLGFFAGANFAPTFTGVSRIQNEIAQKKLKHYVRKKHLVFLTGKIYVGLNIV